jgi:hypothetical protein
VSRRCVVINFLLKENRRVFASMSSLKKGRPGGVQGGQLVQMLDRQRAQQAVEDAAKKTAIADRNLVDATKEGEETSIAAAAAAALSAPEEAQVSLIGSTATAACCSGTSAWTEIFLLYPVTGASIAHKLLARGLNSCLGFKDDSMASALA